MSMLRVVVLCSLCVGAEERATVTPVTWLGRHADTEVAAATVDGDGNLIVVGRSWAEGMGTKGAYQRRSRARSNYGFHSLAENRILPVASTWTEGSWGELEVDATNGRRVCWTGRGLAGALCSEDAGRHWRTLRGVGALRNLDYISVTGVQGDLVVAMVRASERWNPGAWPTPGVSRDGGATFSVTAPNPAADGWHSQADAPCRLLGMFSETRSEDCGVSWTSSESGIRPYWPETGSSHPDPSVLLGYKNSFPSEGGPIYWSLNWGATWQPLFESYPAGWWTPMMHPGKVGTWIARSWPEGWKSNDMSGRGWVALPGIPSNADVIVDYACGAVYLRELRADGYAYSITDRNFGPARQIVEGAGVPKVAPCEGIYFSQVPTADAFVAKFDPAGRLQHFTYLGGAGEETARSVAVDGKGDIYVSGLSDSPDFPFTHRLRPWAKGFVVKFTADLSEMVFSTGVPAEDGPRMKLGADGSVFLLGVTNDLTMPTAGAAISREFELVPQVPGSLEGNGYLLRLSSDGRELLYSTSLGRGYPFGFGLDGEETAYVWRHGSLPGGPDAPSAAFHKLDLREGKVLWSVLPGGVLGTAREVEVQTNGDVVVTGGVANPGRPFPPELASFQAVANPSNLVPRPIPGGGTPPPQSLHLPTEGFLARVGSDGRLLAGTFLGGALQDYFTGSVVAADGSVIAVGQTVPAGVNTRSIAEQAALETPAGLVAKLDGKMQKAAFSTLLTGLVPAAAAPHAEGGYWLVGTGKTDADGLGVRGIVLARLTTEPARLPRIDQVVMDVVPEGVLPPRRRDVLWPTSTARVTGEWAGESPVVTLGGRAMEVRLARPGQLWFRVPDDFARGVFDLVVEAGGVRAEAVRVRVQ